MDKIKSRPIYSCLRSHFTWIYGTIEKKRLSLLLFLFDLIPKSYIVIECLKWTIRIKCNLKLATENS